LSGQASPHGKIYGGRNRGVAYGVIDEVVSSRTFSVLVPSASAPTAHHEVVLMYKTSLKVKLIEVT